MVAARRARDAAIAAAPADRAAADERWRGAADLLVRVLAPAAGPVDASASSTAPDPLVAQAWAVLRTAQPAIDAHRAHADAGAALADARRELAADPREAAWRQLRQWAGELGAILTAPSSTPARPGSTTPATRLTLRRHLRAQPPAAGQLTGVAAVRQAVDLVLDGRLPEAVALARILRVPPSDRVSGVELIGRVGDPPSRACGRAASGRGSHRRLSELTSGRITPWAGPARRGLPGQV
ncbi:MULTISPECIES: hypothetical protein [unclassified Solwaraspora]|uniref:hypothetical protein n=1 Tax=unclassified Solwaraspora TaxID=2627926 RepID=UPI00259BABD5|nr:hypothetical protein [Solwaraspora sp. WMMA2056]WJK38786.1 hypothetical protein O7608_20055 [Solwaraspora sp. WMMA2056]